MIKRLMANEGYTEGEISEGVEQMTLIIGKLEGLTVSQVVTIFKERVAVFVVEQNCPYQEIDEADYQGIHLGIWQGEQLLAYSRIIDKGDYVSFGRVLVSKKQRGKQLGREIVGFALAKIAEDFTDRLVKISAQAHLTKFYETFGFQAKSDIYLEDGIPHVDMEL